MTTTVANGTLTIKYTADPVKLNKVLLAASLYLYPHYPIQNEAGEIVPVESLTNTQRLAVIDQHIRRVIVDAARTQTVNAALSIARETAESEDVEL